MLSKRSLGMLILAGLAATPVKGDVDKPVITWGSSPVRPGETVLLHGGDFGEALSIDLVNGDRRTTVRPISRSDASLMFSYPEEWGLAVLQGTVRSGGLCSEPFEINTPTVWWIQGDWGKEASPGGWIRLFGNLLAREAPAMQVQLRDRSGKVRTLDRRYPYSSRWTCGRTLPADMPEGEYRILLTSYLPNARTVEVGGIKIARHEDPWKQGRFNVVAFGAVPNDGIDDTDRVLAALDRLKENDGGVLYFPRGRFQMTQTIELPPNSCLQGEDQRLSQLYWPDTFEPPEALVRGTHSFGVKDIFLTCGNHRDGIVSDLPDPYNRLPPEEHASHKTGHITLENVTLRMLYTQYVNSNKEELKRRLESLHYVRALRLGGEFIRVRSCDIYCAAGGVFEVRPSWSEFVGNTFSRGNVIGWNGFAGQQIIFENNHLGGANCTSFYGLPRGSENIYWADNVHENNFDGNNRETITGDGRKHAYMDTATNVTPTTFELKGEIKWPYGIDTWTNGAVQIAGGKGVGQLRRIAAIGGTEIKVSSPWQILPDKTSIFNISTFRRRFIYTGNAANDSTVALQLYGSMIEGIFENNTTARTGGYSGDAMSGEANWFNQFLSNTILTGNTYRGPRNEVPATDAHLGLLAYGSGTGTHRYPLVRSCILRGNHLYGNARLQVKGWVVDSLIEANTVQQADVGAEISESARNIVMRNNSFDRVDRPYLYDPATVVISSNEVLHAAISGALCQVPRERRDILNARLTPILTRLKDAAPGGVEKLFLAGVRILAEEQRGTLVTSRFIETLLGIGIQTPNWRTAYAVLRDGQAGANPLLLRVAGSRCAADLTITVSPDDRPAAGWSFSVPPFSLARGEDVDQNMTLTKPEGKAPLVRMTLHCDLSGDAWGFKFKKTIFDPSDAIYLNMFRTSPPFDNPLGNQNGLGYIPYGRFAKPPEKNLIEAPTEHGRFAFASLFESEAADKGTGDGKLVYGLAILNAARRIKVRLQFDRSCLLYVNGRIVGTTLGRGQWGFADIEEGDNRIELLMRPSSKGEWRCSFPRITWADNLRPGELNIQPPFGEE